jgi:drug/metabolite transporter (DMT)-like permease
VLLVNTSPAVVATFSYLFLGERLTCRGLLGLSCSFLGGAVLVWNDLHRLGDWRGSVLALLGAVMLAVYLLVGRKLRQNTSLVGYIYPTYVLAAFALAIIVVCSKTPVFGFSWETYFFLLLLGLVPQCIGHTCYNWALRYLSATLVSIIILGEPVLATVMAWGILGETIGAVVVLGAGLVGVGILMVSRWGIRPSAAHDGHSACH